MKKLFQQNVDTFKGLGDPGFDSHEAWYMANIRCRNTLAFINTVYGDSKPGSILDVAGPSVIGRSIANYYECPYSHTTGDIDRDWSVTSDKVDLVIMTEVLEHILNPLKFMEELNERVDFKRMIVTWPCRPSFLWTEIHYHELRMDRFRYLCKRARYKIFYTERKRMPESWHNKFKGIRPFLRYFFNYHYMAYIKPIF